MTELFTIHCAQRTAVGRNSVERLRAKGMIPAVVYGHNVTPQSLMVAVNPFSKLYKAAGESSLVDMIIGEEKPIKVIIHDIQRDPVSNAFTHIDFYQVNMSEKITAEVELVFEGIAPAVKELGGILVKNLTHIKIECLPADLPHTITIDITTLHQFNDNIRISGITIPNGVTVLHDANETIVLVTAPRSEEELKALEETVVENVQAVEVSGAAEKEAEQREKEAAAGEPTSEKK